MEEVEMEVEEVSPSDRVLFNGEMLDHIFSHLDPTSLVASGGVCHKWRSVATISLKRRMSITNCIGWQEDIYKSCETYRKLNRPTHAIALNQDRRPKLYDPRVESRPQTEFDLVIGNAVDELPLPEDVRREREELARRRAPAAPAQRRPPAALAPFPPRRPRFPFEEARVLFGGNDEDLEVFDPRNFMGRGRRRRLELAERLIWQVRHREIADAPDRAEIEPMDMYQDDERLDEVAERPRVEYGRLRIQIARPNRERHRRLEQGPAGPDQHWRLLLQNMQGQQRREEAEAPTTLSDNGKPKLLWTPLMMMTMLELDWLKSVTHLILGKFLNIDDWNAVGCKILEAFGNIEWFELYLKNNRSLVLPLSYGLSEAGSQEVEKFPFHGLKTVKIECAKDIITGPTGPTNFDYSFLEKCPNLKSIKADIKWDLENSRYQIEATVVDEETENWVCRLEERAIEYNMPAFEDIKYLLNFVRPTDLTLKVTMDLLAALTPSASTRLRILTLHQETLVTAPINKIIPVLQKNQALNNVKKFAWVPEIHHITANSDVDESIATRAALSNVVTVRLDRSKLFGKDDTHAVLFLDTWNQQKISRIVPNTKLLILSYCSTSSGTENLREDPQKVLKLGKSFKGLDHLVLMDMREGKDDRNRPAYECPLKYTDFKGFQELRSLTLILRSNVMMASYIELILDAYILMPSLKRICIVYLEATMTLSPFPERLEGFPPDITTICGDSTRLDGKVILPGLEEAFITWDEIKSCK